MLTLRSLIELINSGDFQLVVDDSSVSILGPKSGRYGLQDIYYEKLIALAFVKRYICVDSKSKHLMVTLDGLNFLKDETLTQKIIRLTLEYLKTQDGRHRLHEALQEYIRIHGEP